MHKGEVEMTQAGSTTIRINRDTLKRLHDRKSSGETHDDLLNRLLDGYDAPDEK